MCSETAVTETPLYTGIVCEVQSGPSGSDVSTAVIHEGSYLP
jgi:hypothetical protein